MRYIYSIKRDDAKSHLVITELVRRTEDENDTLGVQEYQAAAMEKAALEGKSAVVLAFRNERFFPPSNTADAIAEKIISIYGDQRDATDELTVEEITAPPIEPKRYEVKPADDGEAETESDYIDDEFGDDALLEADDLDDDPVNLKVQDEDLADDFSDDI